MRDSLAAPEGHGEDRARAVRGSWRHDRQRRKPAPVTALTGLVSTVTQYAPGWGQRRMPVWPTEYRPGWGQTQSPWGCVPTGIVVTAPVVVSKT